MNSHSMCHKLVTVMIAVLASCAQASDLLSKRTEVTASIEEWGCDRLIQELIQLTAQQDQLTAQVNESLAQDKAMRDAGMPVYWPTLFAVGGVKAVNEKRSSLSQQTDKIQTVVKKRGC